MLLLEDRENSEHTETARRSIDHMPGHDIVFNNVFIGETGFTKACEFAINGKLPKIAKSTPKPATDRSLEDAITKACELARNS